MKSSILALICLFIWGCASVTKVYGPSGKQAYSLNCSGNARSWDVCYKAAGDICGLSGYKILQQNSEGISNSSFTSTGFFSSTSSARSMLIECN